MTVHLGRQLGVGELSHRHKDPDKMQMKYEYSERIVSLLVSFNTRVEGVPVSVQGVQNPQ